VREVVPAALAGERVDRAVALLGGLTRAVAAELVAAGRVRLDGAVVATRSLRVRGGEVLEVDLPVPAGTATVVPDPTVAVPVVFADADVIVVDKPAGLVVHPGAGHRSGTLVHGLLARFPELATVGDPRRPGIVHRLDRGTSGLLVVARSPRAHASLTAQLAARRVERRYVALVRGHMPAPAGVIDAPIGRSARVPTRMAVVAGGRIARTRYEVLRTFARPEPMSLLACRLETGRTHQIRVHLAAVGHPVVGDDRYGGRSRALGLDRPFLHAAELAFEHPATGEQVRFTSALPPDLQAVLDHLEATG
jgi:23S rRNA pseudouridine1911/1915/1917 synthase